MNPDYTLTVLFGKQQEPWKVRQATVLHSKITPSQEPVSLMS